MPQDITAFSRKHLKEQLRYLEDLYGLVCLETRGSRAVHDTSMLKGLLPKRGAGRVEERKAAGDEALNAAVARLRKRVGDFEKKLRSEPDAYPMGVFFREAGLDAQEKRVVAVVAAVAAFGEGGFRGISGLGIREIAGILFKDPLRRLEAEFSFMEDCRLERMGIIEIQTSPLSAIMGGVDVNAGVTITRDAYRAVFGKSDRDGHETDESSDREPATPGLLTPRVKLRDVVLHPAVREQVLMAIAQARNDEMIFEDWGLGRRVIRGRCASMLFTGPPGTGKTLAAEAVAGELGKKLLVVKGSDVINCYWGKSERNAARVFSTASRADAVLLFDEADSYFYRRYQGTRSIDESSNRVVNTLLGCLEEAELPVILTTNRAEALDPALERRTGIKVVFAPPAAKERLKIWRMHLPRKIPLAPDVDVRRLAEEYELTGGQIKNAVVAAARSAVLSAQADDGGEAVVTMADLERACESELAGSRVFGTAEPEIGFRPR